MNHFSRRIVALLGISIFFLTACAKPEANSAPEFFHDLVGTWSGTQRMLGTESEYEAQYKIQLSDSGVLVQTFSSNWNGAFTGREEMRFDPADGMLHATWTDTDDPEESSTIGSYDPANKTLTMTGTGVDWNDPEKVITFKHVTVYSPGKTSYTMYLVDSGGTETAAMWINVAKVE